MSKYADVYVLPIAEDKVAEYKKIATKASKIFIKHGALKYREYVMSDPKADGVIPFPKLIKLKPGESLSPKLIETRR